METQEQANGQDKGTTVLRRRDGEVTQVSGETLEQRIARLEAENSRLTRKLEGQLLTITPRGAVQLAIPGMKPTSHMMETWRAKAEYIDRVLSFIDDHEEEIKATVRRFKATNK